MRKIAKVFGLLGGISAVIWAMRDRFVSVAISREPEPPAFRKPVTPVHDVGASEPEIASGGGTGNESATPRAAESSDTGDTDLTTIDGIGPVYAERLRKAGIEDVDQLTSSRPEQVAAAAEVALSRAIGWIQAARSPN